MGKRRHLQIVTSDGKNREDACYHRTRHLPRVDIMRLEPIESLCLKLVRYICESLANESAHGWEEAHALARRELGESDGVAVVSNVTALLYAIRAERQRAFSFMVADCPICSRHLCEEERAILELLRAARSYDGTALTDHACALVGEGMVVCVVLAASALGAQVDAHTRSANFQRPSQAPG